VAFNACVLGQLAEAEISLEVEALIGRYCRGPSSSDGSQKHGLAIDHKWWGCGAEVKDTTYHPIRLSVPAACRLCSTVYCRNDSIYHLIALLQWRCHRQVVFYLVYKLIELVLLLPNKCFFF
jgi:hypothetical protein